MDAKEEACSHTTHIGMAWHWHWHGMGSLLLLKGFIPSIGSLALGIIIPIVFLQEMNQCGGISRKRDDERMRGRGFVKGMPREEKERMGKEGALLVCIFMAAQSFAKFGLHSSLIFAYHGQRMRAFQVADCIVFPCLT